MLLELHPEIKRHKMTTGNKIVRFRVVVKCLFIVNKTEKTDKIYLNNVDIYYLYLNNKVNQIK